MLTTKKWGEASPSLSSRNTGEREGHPIPPRPGPRALAVASALLACVILCGCSPAGPAALREGQKLLQDNQAADAVPWFKEAVILLATNAPACAQAWNHLGLAYHYSGRPELADKAYQQALAKDFNLFAARYNRGCLLLELGNAAGAVNEFTTYTSHQPSQPDGWLKLGTAQLRLRQFEPADRSLQQALKLNLPPDDAVQALNALGISQALRHHPREAFQYFHAALKQQTNYAPALLNEAILAQQYVNDKPFALQRFRSYLAVTTNGPTVALVEGFVRQLEIELRPPPTNRFAALPPATNTAQRADAKVALNPSLTTGRTNAAPPSIPSGPAPTNTLSTGLPARIGASRTNAVLAATVSTTNPASAPNLVASTAAPPSLPRPPTLDTTRPPPVVGQTNLSPVIAVVSPKSPPTSKAIAAPPPEVVTLPPEPDIQPAKELAAPAPPDRAVVSNRTVEPTTDADQTREKPNTYAPLRPLPNPKPPKKSLVQKLNPLNWFASAKKTPEPGSSPETTDEEPPERQSSNDAEIPKPPPPPPVVTPVPAAPPPPRYIYRNPSKPAAGDRASANLSFSQAARAQTGGHASEAIADYRKAVEADPSFFEAWYNLGLAAYQSADWPQSLAAYEQALAINPADLQARFNFALALQKANYPLDAAAELESILASHPDDVSAHFTLGNLFAQSLHLPRKAHDHYVRVLQLEPRHPQAAAIRYWLAAHP